MTNYLLDTNILINFVRNKRSYIVDNFDLQNSNIQVYTSIVSIGEIRSFAMVNHWGASKHKSLEALFNEFPPLNIHLKSILQCYAEIDAFSLSHHPTKKLKTTARVMGKNDLWIAATASVLNATLITTDKDFQHLHNEFLQVAWVDASLIY